MTASHVLEYTTPDGSAKHRPPQSKVSAASSAFHVLVEFGAASAPDATKVARQLLALDDGESITAHGYTFRIVTS